MSGGTGGSSGQIDYPDYMKTQHEDWLYNLDYLITNTGNPALSPPSPPQFYLSEWELYKNAFINYVATLTTDIAPTWGSIATSIVAPAFDNAIALPVFASWFTPTPAAEAEITASVAAFEAVNDDNITNIITPRFQAGMRDINAVNTSAFIYGIAQIEAFGNRDVNKYQGDLRIQAFLQKDRIMAEHVAQRNQALIERENRRIDFIKETALKVLGSSIAWQGAILESKKSIVSLSSEFAQVTIKSLDAYIEGTNKVEIELHDYPMKIYQYGANMMASIAGAAISKETSSFSNFLSGAASGAMFGSNFGLGGAGIGGLLGGFASLLGF